MSFNVQLDPFEAQTILNILEKWEKDVKEEFNVLPSMENRNRFVFISNLKNKLGNTIYEQTRSRVDNPALKNGLFKVIHPSTVYQGESKEVPDGAS